MIPTPTSESGSGSSAMYAGTLSEMRKDRKFYRSDNFIIACGCVTFDPARKLVLLIKNKKWDIYQLPKGRKNMGEDLLAAALREAWEETGVRVTALPLRVPTRATVAADREAESPTASGPETKTTNSTTMDTTTSSCDTAGANGNGAVGGLNGKEAGDPSVTANVINCEPCAVVHAPDPYSGALKHVFYFVAIGDSSKPITPDTQEEWERFETIWADVDKAADMLTFDEDAMVVRKALEDARRSGLEI